MFMIIKYKTSRAKWRLVIDIFICILPACASCHNISNPSQLVQQ